MYSCSHRKIKAIQRQEKMEMDNLYGNTHSVRHIVHFHHMLIAPTFVLVGGKATGLSQFTVQSSSEVVKEIHKALLIYSSNLRIQETIGQGTYAMF